MKNIIRYIFTCLLIICLYSCSTSVAQVEVKKAIQVIDKSKIKPIAISKVVAKMRRGTVIGNVSGGLLCIPQGRNSEIKCIYPLKQLYFLIHRQFIKKLGKIMQNKIRLFCFIVLF